MTTRGHRIRCGCCLQVARPLKDTLRSEAKPIHTIPSMKLTSRNAKEIICRKRFGVLVLFAFFGMNKPDFAPNATSESHGSRVGGFTTASPVCWVVQRVRKTASYFIQSATTRFIASIFPSRNRVSHKEAFEGLELCAGKLACTVLRGLGPSNGVRLLGKLSSPVLRGPAPAMGAGHSAAQVHDKSGSVDPLLGPDRKHPYIYVSLPDATRCPYLDAYAASRS